MEFRQIQYFVCLYEETSVTRAARRLNIVQPALSMQIAKLEEEIGKKLFRRTGQGMVPTTEGRDLYRLFLPIVRDFVRAREAAMQSDAELTGTVKVGLVATVTQAALVNSMAEFSPLHPKVVLAVVDGYSGALSDAVAGGHLDAAIVNKPRSPLGLTIETIAEEDILLLTGPLHHELTASVPFIDILSLKLVLTTRQHGLRGIIESVAEAKKQMLSPSAEIDSITATLKLVQRTDFCTLLPRVAVHFDLEHMGIKAHIVVNPLLQRELVCVTHPRRTLTGPAVAFLTVLKRHIKLAAVGGGDGVADPSDVLDDR